MVRFLPTTGGRYVVRVWSEVRRRRTVRGPFHLSVLGGWLERCTERGSIPFPADGPEFVGDRGGGRRLAGGRRTARAARMARGRSRISSPRCRCGRRRGPQPFSGTSAAAPQAAGLAALVLGRHPDWSPAKVRDALRRAAVDIDPPGHDPETGYGLLRLPND